MISRIWHGWTTREKADAYEALFTLTLFDSLEAVREFAGEDYEVAVVPPEARKLLARFDERSAHYETVLRVE